jgi:hypothetical protein
MQIIKSNALIFAKLLLIIVYFCAPFRSYGQIKKKVLFIGNSYTNPLPPIIEKIALSNGDTLIFDQSTPGGSSLYGHWNNAKTREKIMQGNWDYVTLQDQSQRLALTDEYVETNVFPYALKLVNLIRFHNPYAQIMFYRTWGRKNGDIVDSPYFPPNCPWWPPVCTYEGMDSLLHLRYMLLADQNNAEVSPVGTVWKYIRCNYPNFELYTSDESHPSKNGKYLAAVCFYTAIFRKNPMKITYNYSLTTSEATIIKEAVKLLVYDSLSIWHIGKYDIQHNHTYNTSDTTEDYFNKSFIK